MGEDVFGEDVMTQEPVAMTLPPVYTPVMLDNMFYKYYNQDIVWSELETYILGNLEYVKLTQPELFIPKPLKSFKPFDSDVDAVPATPPVQARTQKAKGITFIKNHDGGFRTLPFELLNGEERDRGAVEAFMKRVSPVFARPCPETPRHGFVDSRKLNTVDEVMDLYRQVKDIDANSEMVIMQPIEAVKNCVITENSITIGPGHDGATAGKKAKVFPIFGKWKEEFEDIEKAGIAVGDVPYLETVSTKDKHYLVQMRGGPAITTRAVDYVPERIVVGKVVVADGDLLEWESIMKSHAGELGVVVDHSQGSLTSHYGVHAILNNIPVLTSRSPEVGETLEVVNDTVDHDYVQVIMGLLQSLSTPYSRKSAAKRVTAMIYSTQYFSALGGKQSYFIGNAIGTMLNYGIAACGGEMRHHKNSKTSGVQRDRVYTKATRDFIGARKRLGKWANSFALDYWNGGFGGLKWYDCAEAVIELDTATRAFLRTPLQKTFADMMMAMNRAINCAHNGGWWFNKFVDSDVFNRINDESLPKILDAVLYMYDIQHASLDLQLLDMYQKYSNCKLIDTKLDKTAVRGVVSAQIRVLHSEHKPLEITKDMAGIKARIQIMWENSPTHDERDIKVDGINDKWDWESTNFQKSYATQLEAYVPLTWDRVEDEWVFYLASNQQEMFRTKVLYQWAVKND